MSAEPSTQLVDCDGLRESLAEICSSEQEFRRFFSGLFDELDVLSAELVRRQGAWQAEREQSEADFQEQAARLEQQRATIAAQREQAWSEVQEKLAGVAAEGGEAPAPISQILDEAERERTALRSALEAAQAQADRLSQAVAELSEASQGLTEVRQEVQRLRQGVENVQAERPTTQTDGTLHQQLQQMEKERAELQQERLVLETELENVRNRAAELAEALAEQQRETAEQRDQWTQELKRMRHLLETLSAQRPEPRAVNGSRQSHVEFPASAQPSPVAAAASKDDPALASVMAQFEILQRDLVRRRKSAATSS